MLTDMISYPYLSPSIHPLLHPSSTVPFHPPFILLHSSSSIHPPFILLLPSIHPPFTLHSPSIHPPFTLHSPSIHPPFTLHSPYSFTLHSPFIQYTLIHLPTDFTLISRVILPLGQSYVLASYFSVWKKFLRAIVENAVFYITLTIIFVVLFIYLVVVKKIVAL